jgi:UDP-N-acetylmuramyl tripeptide synthase
MTIARAAGRLSRALGRGGGTSLPGHVLLRLDDRAPERLAAGLDHGVAVVSATNGKTTTARMIVACMRSAAWVPVANSAGANLLSGVATSLLDASTRRPRPDAGLFEVDEAALPEVVTRLRPRVVLLMNLFRDQLDRYGELEAIAARWEAMVRALPPEAVVVANADDPAILAIAGAVEGPATLTFGLEDTRAALEAPPHAADSTRCRRCGTGLEYAPALLGHMGHWRCPSCGLARPTPDVRAVRVDLDGLAGADLQIETPSGPVHAHIGVPGLHNAYNATAAVAAALALGIPREVIGPALGSSAAAFGRGERVALHGRELVLLLAKNPAGANETVRTVLMEEGPLHLLISLNDRTADGQDVSWIWDVDYEPLLERAERITVTGDRAHDMALRLVYGGLAEARLHVAPAPADALDAALAAAPIGARVYALPTYTAMLDLRDILVERGAVEEFWRDGRAA